MPAMSPRGKLREVITEWISEERRERKRRFDLYHQIHELEKENRDLKMQIEELKKTEEPKP